MQVYAWRKGGGDVGRQPKRPYTPWSPAEINGLPAGHTVAQKIFDRLVIPTGARDGAGSFRVGVCGDLSPSIGVYHNGLAELSRLEIGDRVHVTWLRGFWDSLHVIYRTNSATDAREFARRLVQRAKAVSAQIAPDNPVDVRISGVGELRDGPYYVFVLVGHGRAAQGLGRIATGQASLTERA